MRRLERDPVELLLLCSYHEDVSGDVVEVEGEILALVVVYRMLKSDVS